ncbi:MAG: hypothetical protein ACRD5L_17730, partial [Bryobacteraceae bacterium]
MLKARALAATGKRADAATLLEGLPDVESNAELTALLLDQYLQDGRASQAADLSMRVFGRDPKSYKFAHQATLALLESGDGPRALELLGAIRHAMAEHGDHELLAQTLNSAAGRLSGKLEPLEWLVELHSQSNDSFHLPESLNQLGQAAAASGNFECAEKAYAKLLERTPEDRAVRQNLDQVRSRLGLSPAAAVASEPPREPVPDQAPAPPKIEEPALDEETQRYVTLALTDVDLFSSYGLTQKAIDLLEKVIERVPRHTATLEKLLDLHLGEGNSQRTSQLAALLTEIHAAHGDQKQADRFRELQRRFQRVAALDPPPAPTPAAPAEFQIPEPQPVAPEEMDAAQTTELTGEEIAAATEAPPPS